MTTTPHTTPAAILPELLDLIRFQQEYIVAIPSDVAASLPAMPGFDGDWAVDLVERAKALAASAPVAPTPTAWRELCRRLYVELFHCDKQMTCSLNEDGEPIWRTGPEVRDVLSDAKAALEANPITPEAAPVAPTPTDVLPQDTCAFEAARTAPDWTQAQKDKLSTALAATPKADHIPEAGEKPAPLQQGEYLPLPIGEGTVYCNPDGSLMIDASLAFFDGAKIGDKLYTADQVCAAIDADRAERLFNAARAAPAQAATAKQSPHPEYDKGFSDGWNRCEARQAAAPAQAGEPWYGHKFKESQSGIWRCECGKTVKETTADWLDMSADELRNLRTETAALCADYDADRAARAPAQPDPWHQAVIDACFQVESCYLGADPVKTVNSLIDWHVQNERRAAQAVSGNAKRVFETTMRRLFGNEFPTHPNETGQYPGWDDYLAIFQSGAAQVAPDNRVPEAWTNLLAYALQDDMHNRLTPRVVDIAYTAFMLAKRPNDEDGGASDWFNDTKPKVAEMIAKLRKDLIEELAPAPVAEDADDAARWRLLPLFMQGYDVDWVELLYNLEVTFKRGVRAQTAQPKEAGNAG